MTDHPILDRGRAAGDGSGVDDLLELLATVADRVETSDSLVGESGDAQENRAIHASRAWLARAGAQQARSEGGEVRQRARALSRPAGDARHRSVSLRLPPTGGAAAADGSAAAPTVDEGVALPGEARLRRLVEGARHVGADVRWAQIALPRAGGPVAWSAGALPAAAVAVLEDGPRAAVLAGGGAVHTGGDGEELPAAGVRGVLALPAGPGALVLAATGPFDGAATLVAHRLAERVGVALDGVDDPPEDDAATVLDGACAVLGQHLDTGPDTAFEVILEVARASDRPALGVAQSVVAALVPRAVGRGGDPEPAVLRRAESYLVERAGDAITTADVADAAGIGLRGLQQLFRRHHGLTPTQYLRRVRLERAHAELREADPSTLTVGAVAARWHFGHPGRFSVAYREYFGTSPNRTLRA